MIKRKTVPNTKILCLVAYLYTICRWWHIVKDRCYLHRRGMNFRSGKRDNKGPYYVIRRGIDEVHVGNYSFVAVKKSINEDNIK